ncbi:MAG: lactate dehydrogenase [Clostridia bacterium]|nr:lactate dehydrogenase [Clostridia bacterium]
MKLFVYAFRESDEREIFDELAAKYGFTYGTCAAYPSVENAHLAQGYDAITFTPCTFAKEQIDAFHAVGVRYIAARSIGFNHIDIPYAHARGMGVSHVDYPPDTVADYTVMLMLMGCRKAAYILERARLQDYSLAGKLGCDIGDLTVGIIGAGKIGATVIQRLAAFGCRILVYDVFENENVKQYASYASLDELIAKSDMISLHTLVTEENVHILNDEAFARMKDGVMIINTARGLLIDTPALIRALNAGKVGFAGLDVLENEDGLYYYNRMGDCIDNPNMAILRAMPNVVLMPHTAFYTRRVAYAMAENVVKCVLDMQAGRENPLINT